MAHTAGIVMFTLLVNATTMKKLLEKLGMSDISDAKKIAMANAVRQIQESNHRTLTMLKADRFLADADWDIAERDCEMHNPYMYAEGEVRGFLINFDNMEVHMHKQGPYFKALGYFSPCNKGSGVSIAMNDQSLLPATFLLCSLSMMMKRPH